MIITLIRSHLFSFHSFSIALGDKNIMVPLVRERFPCLFLWKFMEWCPLLTPQAFLSSYLLNGVHVGSNFSDYWYVATRSVRRRQWRPTPVLLLGKPHERRSPVGCSPWGRPELDRTERLHFLFSPSCIGEGNGNPLHCSCLENPRDRGAWWAAVYGVTQSRTWLKQLSSSSRDGEGQGQGGQLQGTLSAKQLFVMHGSYKVVLKPVYLFPISSVYEGGVRELGLSKSPKALSTHPRGGHTF